MIGDVRTKEHTRTAAAAIEILGYRKLLFMGPKTINVSLAMILYHFMPFMGLNVKLSQYILSQSKTNMKTCNQDAHFERDT